jgi:hypothetical protein
LIEVIEKSSYSIAESFIIEVSYSSRYYVEDALYKFEKMPLQHCCRVTAFENTWQGLQHQHATMSFNLDGMQRRINIESDNDDSFSNCDFSAYQYSTETGSFPNEEFSRELLVFLHQPEVFHAITCSSTIDKHHHR